jgi:AcrR family transcriptional regulator
MENHSHSPTGLTGKRRRLTDQETERRMLETAVATVQRSGLTVSLDHISFENLIHDADVARSAVYRRWPYKDLFFSDLVRELAKNATPTLVNDEVEMMKRVIGEYSDWIETPEKRHGLLLELFRQISLLDFEAVYQSPQWRTYIALHATFMSLADGELREQVQSALSHTEQSRIARIASSWEQIATLFGYRLRVELGASFETLATLLNAELQGLALMALSMPNVAKHRFRAQPFEAIEEAEWSVTGIGTAILATAFLEPDPTLEWNDNRITNVRRALDHWSPPKA